MKLNIRVIAKPNNTRTDGPVCPWILDVPPMETGR